MARQWRHPPGRRGAAACGVHRDDQRDVDAAGSACAEEGGDAMTLEAEGQPQP